MASNRLQNAQDDDDPIVSELLRLLSSDSSAEVRVNAVQVIIVCKRTLPEILMRVRDIDASVRKACYSKLQLIDPRMFNRQQRCHLVRFGLQDRDADVLSTAKAMFLEWMQYMDHNIPRTIQLFGVDEHDRE
eukprot:gene14292-18095_t